MAVKRWRVVLLGIPFIMALIFSQYWLQQTDTVEFPDPNTKSSRGYLPRKKTRNFCSKGKVCKNLQGMKRYWSQSGEDRAMYTKYFSDPPICNGTYLEIGALDGVKYSNTKFFEDYLGWTGVLIEAQPDNFKKLKKNRPKSKIYGVAICPENKKFVMFVGKGATGGEPVHMSEHHKKRFIKNAKPIRVPCMTMSNLLKDAHVTHIDLFSLDVEGAELAVLETMDWNIPIRTLVVEYGHNKTSDEAVRTLLRKHKYIKASWNIRSFCRPGGDCASNEVWENTNLDSFICN